MSSGFGVPKMDWSPLQAIGQQLTINAELERQREIAKQLGSQIQAGNYEGAAQAAFQAGDTNTGLGVLKLAQTAKQQRLEQEASQQFAQGLGGAFGGASSGAPVAAAVPSPVAPGFGGGTSATRADGSPINQPGGPAARALQQAGAGASALPQGAGGAIQDKFVSALREGGLTNPFGLGAVAAYANHESRYSPKNIVGSWSDPSERGQAGTSGGILSWRDERLDNMRKFTAGASDPVVAQAQFTLKENPALTQALQNAKSPEEAHKLMADAWRFAGYNRPGGENAARLNSTREYAARVGGGEAPVQVASLGGATGLGGASTASAPQQPGLAPEQQPQTIGQTPVASIAQSPLGQRIPFLLKAAAHPNLPDGQRQLAQTLLKTALDETRMSDEQKDYTLARSQGFGGTFLEYKQALKSERGPTVVGPGSTLVGANGQPLFTAPDRDKSQEGEAKLRGEFNTQIKDFGPVQDAYGRVVASVARREAEPAAVSPAADMSLVFGFMKMLDPGSVVREGEYATARNAAGVPEQVLNTYNRLLSGEFLNQQQRQDFVNQAQQLYAQARGDVEGKATRYRDLAKQSGYDEGRVVSLPAPPRAPQLMRPAAPGQPAPGQPMPSQPGQPAPSGPSPLQGGPAIAAPPGVPTAVNPATGQRLILQNGQWVPVPNANTEGRPQA